MCGINPIPNTQSNKPTQPMNLCHQILWKDTSQYLCQGQHTRTADQSAEGFCHELTFVIHTLLKKDNTKKAFFSKYLVNISWDSTRVIK